MPRPRVRVPATAENVAIELAQRGKLTQSRFCDELGVNQRTWRRIILRDEKALEIYQCALDIQRDLLIQQLMTKTLLGDKAAPGGKISAMFPLKSVHGLRDHGESSSSKAGKSDAEAQFRFHRWKANLSILDVTEIKSVPYVPMSHPFIERVIGTIRREYLDHVPFWNSLDLSRKLDQFKDYCNDHRTHAALSGQSPIRYSQQSSNQLVDINNYNWRQHCFGLFHTPIPA